MNGISPYDEALSIIRKHPGTGGAGSLAKLLLSLYNHLCSYSVGECLSNLDDRLSAVALRMVQDYAANGETEDLRAAGKIVIEELYPGLWEMGLAMRDARDATRQRWQQEEQDREAAEIVAAENEFLSDAGRRSVPPAAAEKMIRADEDDDGKIGAYCFVAGSWQNKKLQIDQVRAAVREHGTGFIYCAAESSKWLGVVLNDRLYYVYPDYDAREEYLASIASTAI